MIKQTGLPADLNWLNSHTNRNYYNALWATLVHLKPINCLEIGTFLFYSAKVFSRYFQEYAPDGKLITLDISTWNREENPPSRVYPLMVYPHRVDIDQFHGDIQVHHNNYRKILKGKDSAAIINSVALAEKMTELNIDIFDLSFVDGDHTEVSVLADLMMAGIFTKPNGWILVDDFTDSNHDVGKIIKQLRCEEKFYTYGNWSASPDMGLIAVDEFSFEGKLGICL